tara:strand:+ start:4732 stop:5076 length:345 start_codon:yes stop_codon:yes gene_type:complete
MTFFSFLFGGSTPQNEAITILDKPSFKMAINVKKVQLVDVRTSIEFSGGHIQNAINIDFFNHSNFVKAFKSLDKEEPVYLYCRSGKRSQNAARKLLSLGFTKIYDLKGGYMNWN